MSDRDRPRLTSEEAAREREYWIEQASRPRTEEGRRRLARANYWWAEAVESQERAIARSREPEYGSVEAREKAELGRVQTEYARRRWPPGSEVYELTREMATALRTVKALEDRLERRGWSNELAEQLEIWKMNAELAYMRVDMARMRDNERRNRR